MATTSSDAASKAVVAIQGTGVRHAILHGEGDLVRGEVDSDVDIVADRSVHEVVRGVAGQWQALGLYPIIVWPYDTGGTGSIFLTTLDARVGVQLDILHDPEGRGRYGVRSDLLLSAAHAGAEFTTVAPAQRSAYLLAKRISKGQTSEARQLVELVSPAEVDLDVLRPDVANVVRSFMESGSIHDGWKRNPSPGRLLGRLRHPVGAWVELAADDSENVAAELISRFGLFLPHAVHIPGPHLGAWMTSVAPIRWRAGIVASHGRRARITPAPDLSIPERVSVDEACHRTVLALSLRTTESDAG
jgi:hypothetical protein